MSQRKSLYYKTVGTTRAVKAGVGRSRRRRGAVRGDGAPGRVFPPAGVDRLIALSPSGVQFLQNAPTKTGQHPRRIAGTHGGGRSLRRLNTDGVRGALGGDDLHPRQGMNLCRNAAGSNLLRPARRRHGRRPGLEGNPGGARGVEIAACGVRRAGCRSAAFSHAPDSRRAGRRSAAWPSPPAVFGAPGRPPARVQTSQRVAETTSPLNPPHPGVQFASPERPGIPLFRFRLCEAWRLCALARGQDRLFFLEPPDDPCPSVFIRGFFPVYPGSGMGDTHRTNRTPAPYLPGSAQAETRLWTHAGTMTRPSSGAQAKSARLAPITEVSSRRVTAPSGPTR